MDFRVNAGRHSASGSGPAENSAVL